MRIYLLNNTKPYRDSEEQDYFVDCIFEDVKDTVSYGIKHFVLVDGDMQKYDFHLRKESAAIDCANAATSAKTDHDGTLRDEKPDMGAYEYVFLKVCSVTWPEPDSWVVKLSYIVTKGDFPFVSQRENYYFYQP